MKNSSQLLKFTELCMRLATQAANARMDEKLSHRRSLVETVISVIKRKYGAAVSSRRWWRQFRELVAMCLVYFA